MRYLLVFVALAGILVGCGPTVSGRFYDEDGGLVYSGPVSNGETFRAPGGADLVIKGVKAGNITVEDSQNVLGKSSEVETGLIIGGIATTAVVGIWLSLSDFGVELVELNIPPVAEGTRLFVFINGQDFVISISGNPAVEGEGEGEGEGQIEGEGEGQTEGQPDGEGEGQIEGQPDGETELAVSLNSPADGSVISLVGSPPSATVAVSASIEGPNDEVEVIMVSPEGEVYKKTVVPPEVVIHNFTLTLFGPGLFSVRVKDLVTGEVVERTASVTVQ